MDAKAHTVVWDGFPVFLDCLQPVALADERKCNIYHAGPVGDPTVVTFPNYKHQVGSVIIAMDNTLDEQTNLSILTKTETRMNGSALHSDLEEVQRVN